jgi:RNA polymerase sigma factor (sigma-70 family)
MERPSNSQLLDRNGQPLSEPIQRALNTLVPRFIREFPTFRDVALTEVLEEAGQRVADREAKDGPVRNLHSYVWKTLHNLAVSKLRRSEMRVESGSVHLKLDDGYISPVSSELSSPERIERDILLRQFLGFLTQDERVICILKTAGFTPREIAARLNRSVTSVNVTFWRATRKIRKASVSLPGRNDDRR